MERKLERQRATREFIAEFKRKREEWKAMERQRMEEENHRIKEYAKTQEQRQELAKAEKIVDSILGYVSGLQRICTIRRVFQCLFSHNLQCVLKFRLQNLFSDGRSEDQSRSFHHIFH